MSLRARARQLAWFFVPRAERDQRMAVALEAGPVLRDGEDPSSLPVEERFAGHGFDVRVADLRAGKRFRRTFTGRDGHEYVVNLSWMEEHGCPHVSQYRADLMERLLKEDA